MSPRTWIIAAACLIAAVVFGTAQCSARKNGALELQVHIADSTAKAEIAKAAGEKARGDAEHARAEVERARAESLTVVAQSAGRAVIGQVERAAAARAQVDTATFAVLPATVQRALGEGDSLRLSIPPMVAGYEAAIAAHTATEARLELTIMKKDSVSVSQSNAIAALQTQVRTLTEMQAPRCGWRCGAVLGVVASIAVSRVAGVHP